MKSCTSLNDVIKNNLCISCGACTGLTGTEVAQMKLKESEGVFRPFVPKNRREFYSNKSLFDICPGKGVPIAKLSSQLYQDSSYHGLDFGYFRTANVCRSLNTNYLDRCSSGGMMTQIAAYLLEKKKVDGVTAVRFVQGKKGPRTEAFIATTQSELIEAQGSKYCPTTTVELLRECLVSRKRYLFSGTPCQVAALRMHLEKKPEDKELFPYTMANFCGGYRDFRFLDGIISAAGIKPASVSEFRFRGGGWPGFLVAKNGEGRSTTQQYPNFKSNALVNKQNRCVVCIDGTGLLADFACGDAWIDKYINEKKGYGWSIVVCRSKGAETILNELKEKKMIEVNNVSLDEMRYSQRYNLESKINRQKTRMKLFSIIGRKLPSYDIELPESGTTIYKELRVIILKTKPFLFVNVALRRVVIVKILIKLIKKILGK